MDLYDGTSIDTDVEDLPQVSADTALGTEAYYETITTDSLEYLSVIDLPVVPSEYLQKNVMIGFSVIGISLLISLGVSVFISFLRRA